MKRQPIGRQRSSYTSNQLNQDEKQNLIAAACATHELLEGRVLLSGSLGVEVDASEVTPAIVHQLTIPTTNSGKKTAVAAASTLNIWQPMSQVPTAKRGQVNNIRSMEYSPFGVNEAALLAALAKAPMEFTAAARSNPLILSLPTPDGKIARFKVVESPVMELALARKYSQIKTYSGQGIDDPAASLRLDVDPFTGMNAIVRGGTDGIWAIDPYYNRDKTAFMSYRKSDLLNLQDFKCLTPDAGPEHDHEGEHQEGGPENIPAGSFLRTFRTAITTTTQYNAAHGNTIASVLADVTTVINRITGVYEVDLATRLQLVANTDLLFSGLNGNPILSGGTNVSTLANNNQAFTDGRIGFAAYDVGHVFLHAANNGVSAGGIGIVGSAAKARACSATNPSTGDLFAIDYVSHEMGHQFNGRHNFSNCGGGPGDSGAIANEPGSGSSIMGYAGICGAQNIQNNSDAMFNHINYNQMYPYVLNTISTVGTTTNTGNNAPTISAGLDYVIPSSTPYALTATASDPDGDALVYSWEGSDVGGSAPVNNTTSIGPIVRPFFPTSNPTRTVPRLSNLLNNTFAAGEALSGINRTINFRVVARDNRSGGGGVNFDDMFVSVVNTGAGGFLVTAPNTNVNWPAGSAQTVTWNVAGTTANGINVANVKISLSTDGGNSFPHVVLASTANDGSESVTIPSVPATNLARIKVEAVGNIFFDLSNTNFQISVPVTPNGIWDAGGDGANWNDANNWSNNTLPIATDDVLIQTAGTFTVDLPNAVTVVKSLTLGTNSGSNPTLSLTTDGSRVLQTGALTINGSSKLDLNDNDFILDYTGATQLGNVQALIFAARNGGAWNGVGITSSAAKNNAQLNTSLGSMEGSQFGASFDGQPLDGTTVIVKYTYYGDADFNGKVDGADYAKIDASFNSQPPDISGWFNGDFNGDGKVDGADYSLIDAAFNSQGATL